MSAGGVELVEHPVVASALAELRERSTPTARFRRALARLATVLAVDASRGLAPAAAGPAGSFARQGGGADWTLVPILRAGLGLLEPFLALAPGAAVGTVGVRRDPVTKEPKPYQLQLPPDRGGPVFVLDPMIATGGSAQHALDELREHGVPPSRMRFVAVVTAREGLERLARTHPEVPIFAAACDPRLDAAKEIVPGIGDAGDRLFGTGPG